MTVVVSRWTRRRNLAAVAVLLLAGAPASAQPRPGGSTSWSSTPAARAVLSHLGAEACRWLTRDGSGQWPDTVARGCLARLREGAPTGGPTIALVGQPTATPLDGQVLGRQRIAANADVVMEIVAYASDGLTVAGLLCYPNDNQAHATIVHVHGGLGGVFTNADGDMPGTCYNWAARHRKTAFAPSLRGQDGGDGRAELCLGESTDVINAVAMLRAIEPTAAAPIGLVGGSIGGCVVLRAAPFIPNLSAVVAFVPPLSWGDLITYHRTRWVAAQEPLCGGGTRAWTTGGPALADAFDSVICGHQGCDALSYLARSPLPLVTAQAAPTLIVAASDDNVVPLEQQILWPLFRHLSQAPVDVVVVDRCAPPGQPALSFDGLVVASGGFHLLADGPISSGMLFLLGHLDRDAEPR